VAIRPLYAEASKAETCYYKRSQLLERTVLAMLFVLVTMVIVAVAGLAGRTVDSRDGGRWYPVGR
jgi:hypothetical protein